MVSLGPANPGYDYQKKKIKTVLHYMLTFLSEDSSLVIDSLICWPVSCEGDLQLLKMQPCDHVVVTENKVTHSSRWCVSIFPSQIAMTGVEIPIVCVFFASLGGACRSTTFHNAAALLQVMMRSMKLKRSSNLPNECKKTGVGQRW